MKLNNVSALKFKIVKNKKNSNSSGNNNLLKINDKSLLSLIPAGARKYSELIKDDDKNNINNSSGNISPLKNHNNAINTALRPPAKTNIANIQKNQIVKIPSMTGNNPFLKNFIKK
jgi:hypothetical protein